MLLALYRIIKHGFQDFWRHKSVSLAMVSIMVITLFLVSSVLMVSLVGDELLSVLKNKVDVSVYFKIDTKEEDIQKVKETLERHEEVSVVIYVSRQQALEEFKKANENEPLILKSLEEVGENPLLAHINIKVKNPQNFSLVNDILEKEIKERFGEIIEKTDYQENKAAIEKLDEIISTAKKSGLVVSVILIFVAVLISFNTILLAIYSARDKITIMRLVGSSNWFIQGPFIVEGIVAGIVGALVSGVLFYSFMALITPKIQPWFAGLNSGVNLILFYKENLIAFLVITILVGSVLGALSSFIALRRYLRI